MNLIKLISQSTKTFVISAESIYTDNLVEFPG